MGLDRLRRRFIIAALLLLSSAANAAEKRSAVFKAEDWQRVFAEANQEADDFQSATAASAKAARAKFQQASQALDQLLKRSTTGNEWRRFLQWKRTGKALQNKEVTADELLVVYPYWEQASRSWNEPLVTQAATALRGWEIELARFSGEETAERFRGRLAKIDSAYGRWKDIEHEEDWLTLAHLTNELYRLGEAPALTRFLRQQCSRPNLRVVADGAWMGRATLRNIDETFPVYDQTDRSVASGTGMLTGRAQLEPMPSESGGHLALVFQAQAVSEVSGGVPGVRAGFISRSTTSIEGYKPLEMATSGLLEGPSHVNAQTNIECLSVSRGVGIIPRIAERGIYNGTGDAEQRASNRARQQSMERLDEVSRQLRQQTITQQHHPAIREFIAFSPGLSRSWRTTSRALEGWLWRAGPQLFAGPTFPPQPVTAGAVLVQLHETYLERSLQERWGSKRITFEDIADAIQQALGKDEPMDLEAGWSLQTAQEPAHVHLQDDRVKLILRFEKFNSPTGEFPGLAIATEYRLEVTGGELHLHRGGDIEVTPIAMDGMERQLTGRMLVLTRIVRRNFDELLPREVPIKAVQVGPSGVGAAKPLQFSQTATERGWLTTVLDDQQSRVTLRPRSAAASR